MGVNEIANVVQKIYSALTTLESQEEHVEPPDVIAQEPAVPVKKSVFPDYIVCLEDGKQFKMLKRHLKATYNMTPEEYRSKWGLPESYPMTAPNYSEKRSGLAKEAGLGKKE